MGPCLSPREHALWHAPFYHCGPLDDHPTSVEDRLGHGALRRSPSRAPAVLAAAVAPVRSRQTRAAAPPDSSSSSLETNQAPTVDADDGLHVGSSQPSARQRGEVPCLGRSPIKWKA